LKTYKILSLSLALLFTLSACGISNTEESANKGIEEFNSAEFNSGNSFEDLVNPTWNLSGEESNEAKGTAENSAWLAKIDSYARSNEKQDYIAGQKNISNEQIKESNANLKSLLSKDEEFSEGYTLEEAKLLYGSLVEQNQVSNSYEYSPNSQGVEVGFCFGRAMIVHALSKNAVLNIDGVKTSKKSTPARKIWVTGPMGIWKHHVATMVVAKEKDVGFWVIDNFIGRVVSAPEWMEYLDNMFTSANVMFHVSRANRFSEANSLRYYQVMLDDTWFENFFSDFLRTNAPTIRDQGVFEIKNQVRSNSQVEQEAPDDDEVVEQVVNEEAFGSNPFTPQDNDAGAGEGVL